MSIGRNFDEIFGCLSKPAKLEQSGSKEIWKESPRFICPQTLSEQLENRVNMITFHWPDPKANTEQVALSAECFAMIKLWYPVKLMGPGWPRGEISVQPLRMISDMWARDFVMEILHWYQMDISVQPLRMISDMWARNFVMKILHWYQIDISVFNKYIGSKFHEVGILLNQPLTIPLLVHWDTIHQI